MIAARFDELIHAPTRLAIVALLAAAGWVEFSFVRDSVELSDSALSKQLTTQEQVGYVEIRKTVTAGRPRTSARLSEQGRHAFIAHVAALQKMVAPSGRSGAPTLIPTAKARAAAAAEQRAAPAPIRNRIRPARTMKVSSCSACTCAGGPGCCGAICPCSTVSRPRVSDAVTFTRIDHPGRSIG